MKFFATILSLTAVAAACLPAELAEAGSRTRLRNICRVKGQEENTLRGMGLVVGLNGTGEANDATTMKALARAMEIMGNPVSMTGRVDAASLQDLRKIKNVALVMVSATIPGTGGRRGDKFDCYVSALNGKSLAGGRLAFAALQGPNTQDKKIFALCQGQIQIDNESQPMVGRIHGGCQMEQDVFTPFYKDGYITLVLDKNHADFQIADAIVEEIRAKYSENLRGEALESVEAEERMSREMVHAIDAANVRIKIPEAYQQDPVSFTAQVLEIPIYDAEPEARVVINPRSGSIVISGDVEIGDVLITHRNLVVETTGGTGFASVDVGDANQPKLEQLMNALSGLKVSADDMIEIIRGIDRNGKLHAKLIIE